MNLTREQRGNAYALAGVLFLCPDTLFIRLVQNDIDPFTLLFYKYLGYAIVSILFCVIQSGLTQTYTELKNISRMTYLAGFLWGISNVFFTIGVSNTAVANVLCIIAADPLFSTIFLYFLLKENVKVRHVITSIICFLGILIVCISEFQASNSQSSILGLLSAVAASVLISTYFVTLQAAEKIEGKVPNGFIVNLIAGFIVAFISICFLPFSNMTSLTGIYVFIQGCILLPLSFNFLTIAPTLISAPEVGIYCLIETILGPVLVTAAGFEKAPINTIYATIIIVISVFINAYYTIKEEKVELVTTIESVEPTAVEVELTLPVTNKEMEHGAYVNGSAACT